MIAPRGINFFEIDHHASTADAPYAIITSDCSNPHEIDDGIFVQPLPAAQETYRVGVCVADTSKLYHNGDILKQALTNVRARYWDLPNGERGYDPMLPEDAIEDLELKKGKERGAMIISFVIGVNQPPVDVDINFGKVDVVRNYNYKDMITRCRDDESFQKYARAGTFIMNHLRYHAGGDKTRVSELDLEAEHLVPNLLVSKSGSAWLRGARLNEAYMVAANHLSGKLMAEEKREAIYRVHDAADERYLEFLPPDVALYSFKPGPHDGLRLDPYCRGTSPLRRLEDFMMCYQYKQRSLGRKQTMKDVSDLAAAVQRLNGDVVKSFMQGPLRLGRHETLGKNPQSRLASVSSLEDRRESA
jgi:exoribonuclease R